jgi:hypothetical protein
MTKKDKYFEKFVELRMSGDSFQSISDQLGVSKQTLINWSKEEEVNDQISISRLSRIQNALYELNLERESQVVFYAQLSKKIKDELSKRDINEVPTAKLLSMLHSLESKINDLTSPQIFKDETLVLSAFDPKVFVFDPKL